MALIRALSDEYSHFVSSLLLMDKLEKETVVQAFLTEEIQRRRRATALPSTSAAAMATITTPASLSCDFCGRSGHNQAGCFTFANAMKKAKENAANGRQKRGNGAKKAQEATPVVPAAEFAGNASAVPVLSDPSTLTQPHADFNWNADTGCTSTMTPHRH